MAIDRARHSKKGGPQKKKAKSGPTQAKPSVTSKREAEGFLCAVTEEEVQVRILKAPIRDG